MIQVYVKCIAGSSCGQSEETHSLLNYAVRQLFPEIEGSLRIEEDDCGKPYFPEKPAIYFNLSHAGDYAACAVSDTPVGVDIELCRSITRMDSIIKKFSLEEQQLFEHVQGQEKEDLFYSMWVLKESFIKAIGKGFRVPLDSFTILPGKEAAVQKKMKVVQSINDKTYQYQLCDMKKLPYKLAVCAEAENFVLPVIFL